MRKKLKEILARDPIKSKKTNLVVSHLRRRRSLNTKTVVSFVIHNSRSEEYLLIYYVGYVFPFRLMSLSWTTLSNRMLIPAYLQGRLNAKK